MALGTTVSALTRDKFMPILVDNIFNSNILCHKLLRNADKLDGGVAINVPVEIALNGNSGWLEPGALGTTAQAKTDVASKAIYNWATLYNAVIIDGAEQHINMGSNQVLSMLTASMKNAEKTIKDAIGNALFASSVSSNVMNTLNGAGTFSGTSVLADTQAHDNGNGLIHDFSAGSGTSHYVPLGDVTDSIVGYQRSLGGIDSDHNDGTNDYWNAKLGSFEWSIGTVGGASGGTALASNGSNDTGAVSFANFCSTTSGVAGGIKAMTQMYQACSIDNDSPDIIITTPVIYSAYETALQANKRWEGNSESGDAGFQSLRFKGASVFHDSKCPAGHMYFLNSRYLDFKVHSKRNFAFENFRALEAKDAQQARIFWMGQLTTSAPRYQGLLVGGPTGY
tara:strand:- start:6732 stop:7916 length:1185 start_codon:yes stop_codon:yes gene_type:complete